MKSPTSVPVPLAQQPFPQTVSTVTQNSVTFTPNFSGIKYVAGAILTDDRIWGADNDGVIWKIKWDGSKWIADSAWGSSGRTMNQAYDSEGIAIGDDGLGYFSSERIGSGSTSLEIYQFSLANPTTAGSKLTPSKKWTVTSVLPTAATNLGLEALTFVPEAYLVNNGFKDSTGTLYSPSSYPLRVGGGVFFTGMEANGNVYAFVLNSDSTYKLLATIKSGESTIMDLEFDRATGYLWTSCDNNCAGRLHVFTITNGAFTEKAKISIAAGPITIDSKNVEGFTIEPEVRCGAVTANRKYAYWANDDDGALLRTLIKCGSEGNFLGLSPVLTSGPSGPGMPDEPIGDVPNTDPSLVLNGDFSFSPTMRPTTSPTSGKSVVATGSDASNFYTTAAFAVPTTIGSIAIALLIIGAAAWYKQEKAKAARK